MRRIGIGGVHDKFPPGLASEGVHEVEEVHHPRTVPPETDALRRVPDRVRNSGEAPPDGSLETLPWDAQGCGDLGEARKPPVVLFRFEKLDGPEGDLGPIRKAALGEAPENPARFESRHGGILYDIL